MHALNLILLEKRYGARDFNEFNVIAGFILYNHGDGEVKKIAYLTKSNPRLAEVWAENAEEDFQEMVSKTLPEKIVPDIVAIYKLPWQHSTESELLKAIELLNRVRLILEEAKPIASNLRESLKECVDQLEPLAAKFYSVRMDLGFMTMEIKKLMAEQS